MPADLCRHGSLRAWCLGCEREAREGAEAMAEAAAAAQRTLADENARMRARSAELEAALRDERDRAAMYDVPTAISEHDMVGPHVERIRRIDAALSSPAPALAARDAEFFRRGAEAAREKAAKLFDAAAAEGEALERETEFTEVRAALRRTVARHRASAREVRAMSLPEEKP